jgi:hypothetical protein
MVGAKAILALPALQKRFLLIAQEKEEAQLRKMTVELKLDD